MEEEALRSSTEAKVLNPPTRISTYTHVLYLSMGKIGRDSRRFDRPRSADNTLQPRWKRVRGRRMRSVGLTHWLSNSVTFTGDLHERLISGLPQFQIPFLPLSLSLFLSSSWMNFALRDWLDGKGRKTRGLSETGGWKGVGWRWRRKRGRGKGRRT